MAEILWSTEGEKAKNARGLGIGSHDIYHGRFQYRCFVARLHYGPQESSLTAYVTEIRNLSSQKELHLKSPLARTIMRKLRDNNGLKYVFPYQKGKE